MRLFQPQLPDHGVRQSLYAGDTYLLAPSPGTRQLVERVRQRVEREFADVGPARRAQHHLSDEEFFARVGRLRKELYTDPEHQQTVRMILSEHGFDPGESAFDPIRIRAIADHGFENPRAAPIYYPHRDTWYANPQAQLTWWMPLDDLSQDETFVFFPDCYEQSVPNNSECFDYQAWTSGGTDLRIGWQNPQAGQEAVYPGLGTDRPRGGQGFAPRRAQLLIFAGAHLHETLPNTSGQTRFSIDFRTVHLGDLEFGRGAPNVDNRSVGSAVVDWIRPVVPR